MKFTAEHEALRKTVRDFVQKEINPHCDAWEEAGEFPIREIFKKMGDLGLLGIQKPEEYGGMGLDYSYNLVAAEELGMANFTKARPFQAASASAFSFIVGATAPLLAVLLSPKSATLWIVGVSTIVLLGILGAMGASLGGAGITKGTARTVIWGMTALAVTALVGRVFGTVV